MQLVFCYLNLLVLGYFETFVKCFVSFRDKFKVHIITKENSFTDSTCKIVAVVKTQLCLFVCFKGSRHWYA